MKNSIRIHSAQPRLLSSMDMMPPWKRRIDIFCCVLAIPILMGFALMMAILTSLISPGPLFFRQERIGFRGQRFRIFKFRTMRLGTDTTVHRNHFAQLVATNAPMVKLDAQRDSRLIPLGWLIRASGVDELPQIINVLRGEMSVVGPRPCILSEFELYSPNQRQRTNGFPGLTGLWQVSGKNRTTFERMIELDLHYLRNLSLLRDLQVILLTPWALFVQILDTRLRRNAPIASSVAGPTHTRLRSAMFGAR